MAEVRIELSDDDHARVKSVASRLKKKLKHYAADILMAQVARDEAQIARRVTDPPVDVDQVIGVWSEEAADDNAES